MKKSILLQAEEITSNSRKVDEYGEPSQSFGKASKIASLITGKNLTPEDCIKVIMAIKLTRESVQHKEDNLVDLVGYTRILNDVEESKNKKDEDL